MSPLDTDAIAARLKNATAYPWATYFPREDGDLELSACVKSTADSNADWIAQEIYVDANAEFIAAAPGDIAALLAEVATLKREFTELTICDCGRTKSAPQCPSCDREMERD